MTTNIISDTISTTTDATLYTFEPEININSKIVLSSSLILPTIGDVEDSIQGKQDTIQDNGLNIARTVGLQSALDSKYDTGGYISGSVDIRGDLVVGTTNIDQRRVDVPTGISNVSCRTFDFQLQALIALLGSLDLKLERTHNQLTQKSI